MFKRILVANRGEIALRIIRCCREMDIETVLVFSTADRESLPVQLATYPICIGPAHATKSYLQKELIIDIALKMHCEAIHPGYGFLSENDEFARMCEEYGIIFIGPSAEIIAKMGNKQTARKLMMDHGVPVVPGSNGIVQSELEAEREAERIGYPVLIKASAGGGGRGMRKAFSKKEIRKAFSTAKAEAMTAFGNDEMYIEKLISNPKHIEFQILGDLYGNIIHLGERDCSIQRRNQKMIEEAPSKALSPELREKMGNAAVQAAKAADYYSAGTVEFVLDEQQNFYFIEMNTRIQVEHSVTEMVTGIDLIREQIRIAAGLRILMNQEDIKINGHAIECRINAEDPENNFIPCSGKIHFLHLPAGNGIRVESAAYSNCDITPFYDSMVAKIIVHTSGRLESIRKMRCALEELIVEGLVTNERFQYLIMYHPDYIKGKFSTSFLDENTEKILKWYTK